MIISTYTGIATFGTGNAGHFANMQFVINLANVTTSEIDTEAPTFASASLDQIVSRTWLTTGLTPGSSATVDAQMESTGLGDAAANNVLVVSTF
jgi:hypothetical protein